MNYSWIWILHFLFLAIVSSFVLNHFYLICLFPFFTWVGSDKSGCESFSIDLKGFAVPNNFWIFLFDWRANLWNFDTLVDYDLEFIRLTHFEIYVLYKSLCGSIPFYLCPHLEQNHRDDNLLYLYIHLNCIQTEKLRTTFLICVSFFVEVT